MGRVVSDHVLDNDQGGRVAGSFKDGGFVRAVEVLPGNVIVFRTIEGGELYRETACPKALNIRTITTEHSSISGTVILVLGGFDSDTQDARVVTLSTDYRIQPEVPYQG